MAAVSAATRLRELARRERELLRALHDTLDELQSIRRDAERLIALLSPATPEQTR